MLNEGFCIGGEQSGHIIFRDFMTTGDGQLSGLQLAGLLKKSGQKLSEAASLMETYPQTRISGSVPDGRTRIRPFPPSFSSSCRIASCTDCWSQR